MDEVGGLAMSRRHAESEEFGPPPRARMNPRGDWPAPQLTTALGDL